MAEQYLTKSQAAVYSAVIGGMTDATANAYLQAASSQVDYYCGRKFDTVLEELPPDVGMAVALWAEELTSGTTAGQEKSSERIGDYAVAYETSGAAVSVAYPCPMVVAALLGPYRIITVG